MPISPPIWQVRVERLVKASRSLLAKFNSHADAIDDLRTTMVRDRIVIGLNLSESQTPDGRKLDAESGGNGTLPIEFALYDASAAGAVKVGVKFGNYAAYATTDTLQPYPVTNYTSANGYKYEVTVSGMGSVWIQFTNDVSGDRDKLSAVTMGAGATVPTNTDTIGYLTLGSYTVTGSPAVLTILSGKEGCGNQMYNFANGAHVWGPL